MSVTISQDTIAIIAVMTAVIGVVGYVVKNSLVNSIHEGFKNESWEKQKRWELKQKIYFELLESLYELKTLCTVAYSLHTDNIHISDNKYKSVLSGLAIEIPKLRKAISTASLILDKKTNDELIMFTDVFSELTNIKDESMFTTAIESSTNAFKNITDIAKKDLNIEAV